ncbi:MAG TPA: SDR family NAD(P)-dependent oxidoreductase, partial [Microbacterium sp.]|nr:SDR family NAD(P)-dependent oxidoreductase [Microbacterium sp.]
MTTRRAVVTGASSGIGEATVRALRKGGWDVVGVARRADRLAALEAQTGAAVFAADLTSQADVDALSAWLAESGPVHALVQVAGGARGTDRVESARPEDWSWMFDVNVLAAQRIVAALLPHLRRAADADGYADTVFVTSTAAQTAYP